MTYVIIYANGKTSLLHLVIDHFQEQGLTCFCLDIEDSRNIPIFESIENVEAFIVSRQVDIHEDGILPAIDEFFASNTVIKIFKLQYTKSKRITIVFRLWRRVLPL